MTEAQALPLRSTQAYGGHRQITRAQSGACLPAPHKFHSLPLRLQSLVSLLHALSVSSLSVCGRPPVPALQMKKLVS